MGNWPETPRLRTVSAETCRSRAASVGVKRTAPFGIADLLRTTRPPANMFAPDGYASVGPSLEKGGVVQRLHNFQLAQEFYCSTDLVLLRSWMLERAPSESYFFERERGAFKARRSASSSTSARRNSLRPPMVLSVASWPELLRTRTVSAETPKTRAASEGVINSSGSRLVMGGRWARCTFVLSGPSYQTGEKQELLIES